MLNEKEKQEIRERNKIWSALFELIQLKKFLEAQELIKKQQSFFAKNKRDLNYYSFLIRDIGWLRDEIDASQKGKTDYSEESKNVITELDIWVLIIIGNIMNYPLDDERERILWEANLKFEPIFIHKEIPKEGYASFTEIGIDRDYYKKTYSKLVENTKSKFPKFRNQLEEYFQWNKEKNEKLAKEWGFKK